MRRIVPPLLSLLIFPAYAAAATPIPPRSVPAWTILPFITLLLMIALAPLISAKWWEKYYPLVSLGLGAVVLSYYGLALEYHRILGTLAEYFSFITLVGSLFVTAGGIFLHTERRATPLVNTALLAVGALSANIVGTTGASMLLIRPFMRMNRMRIQSFHVVFFIFIIANMGGALTPIGDPPLFLGYLYGVPFLWPIMQIWHIWLMGLLLLLTIFFMIDTYFYRAWLQEGHRPVHGTSFHLLGSHNFFFLFIILVAVFAQTPVRELIMIGTAAAAHKFAKKEALRANEFTFAPIREVAVLFAGIFATMIPALDWLSLNANKLGIHTPGQFYWAAGLLSSFLDNAPTYLSFLSTALGLHGLSLGDPAHIKSLLADHGRFVQAISVGSVFFGACTYVGNGPNFMVKSIAEHGRIRCPSFFGYIARYTLPILLPIYTLIWILFFR